VEEAINVLFTILSIGIFNVGRIFEYVDKGRKFIEILYLKKGLNWATHSIAADRWGCHQTFADVSVT
jgi:hypothetical protein